MTVADRAKVFVTSGWWMVSWPRRYGLALIGVSLTGLIRYGLGAGLGFSSPFVLFYPPILVMALWGSFGAAMFATGFSGLIAEYYFLPPLNSFTLNNLRDVVGLALFVVSGFAVSVIGTAYRKRSQRLQEFGKAIEGVQEMIAVVNRDYRYLTANRMFLSYFGRQAEDVIGRHVPDIVDGEFFNSTAKPRMDECFSGKIVRFEFRKNYPRGGQRDVAAAYFPIVGPSGVDRITIILQDVTEKKRTEEALRRREEDYRLFVERSSEGIFREELAAATPVDLPEDELIMRIRRDSYVAECNDALAKMYGFASSHDVIGKRLADMLVPEDEGNLEMMREYVRGGFRLLERYSNELDQHGDVKIFRNSMIGIVEEGYLVRTWGIQADVTEQKRLEEAHARAEEQLKASETHFRSLVEQASDGIFITDPDGRYIDVNTAGAAMLGYTRGEILQLSIHEIVVQGDRARVEPEVARFGGGATVRSEWTLRRKDGSTFPGEVCGRRLPDGRLQAILRDMTERRAAEDEMRRSEERFRVALKGSPITVFNQDRDLRYTWIYNPHFLNAEEIIGKTEADLLGAKKAARLLQFERQVLATGEVVRGEVTIPSRGKSHAFDVTLEPLFDADHNVVGITGAYVDIAQLRDMADRLLETQEKLIREKSYLQDEIQKELGFEEIIGQSTSLREVLGKANVVAPTGSTVLLLGETGTGKELVARGIHALSTRREKNFVKLNCAAVPAGLLESELFGHERGAFTSAGSQKVGRIELADKGTLFLDEIGELPLELQPKLLRVLQDRDFERLGGVQTLHVDVRIIAATNRDLRQEAANKTFREDLFYRLSVFPLELPALRERRGDIPILVEHFVEKHAAKMGKHVDVVPSETMKILQNWSWPGNIRELENLIERMVIMTKGRVLAPPPAELENVRPTDDSLTEMEREHILHVLRETNGVLSGTAGAASRLGLKRTTLQSMLKRFNIQAHEYRRGDHRAYGNGA